MSKDDDNIASELLNIKQECEEANRIKNEAQGAFDQWMSQLKKEFGCSTIEQAEKKAEKLQNTVTEMRTRVKKKIAKYKKDFAEWIDEDEEDYT
jgi:hypothetical protein